MLQVPQIKTIIYVTLALVLFSAAKLCRAEAAAAALDMDSASEVRHKRGPTVGLFAFPRVGRSDPDLLEWADVAQLPLELADDYEDYPGIRESKRQGLVPFPRVGRSGFSGMARYWPKTMQQKRAGNSGANSGMWFGPRLGKRANTASGEMKGEQL